MGEVDTGIESRHLDLGKGEKKKKKQKNVER